MTGPVVLQLSVHIAAPPETVFPYFTGPTRYVQWLGGDATLNPKPGGEYRVGMRGGVQAAGVFVEIDPPRRVVFTWGWTGDHPVPPGTTRVVVTLTARDGGTLVLLRHHGLPTDEQRTQHRTGWQLYLGRLHIRVEGGDP
ncbi:MAG TPA: SRPBCC domain-containing protein, partial [Mycobacterium sp.]